MIFNLDDYNKLPDAARRSLTHLRLVRDRMAEDIKPELADMVGEENADELIDDLVSAWLPNSAHARMRNLLSGRSYTKGALDKLEVLKVAVDRIVELERAYVRRSA